MKKSFYVNGKVVQAENAEEAFEKGGASVPENYPPDKGFVIQNYRWSEKDDDFSVEDLSENGYRVFDEWVPAEEYFQKLNDDAISRLGYRQVRIDLVQYHFHNPRVQNSKILIA